MLAYPVIIALMCANHGSEELPPKLNMHMHLPVVFLTFFRLVVLLFCCPGLVRDILTGLVCDIPTVSYAVHAGKQKIQDMEACILFRFE